MKIVVNGTSIELNQNTFLSQGGEGAVHSKSGMAFKIYHESSKMIPVGKIQELKVLDRPNILAPLEVVKDIKDKPIGFAMKYVDRAEYLCKLFLSDFRVANHIDHSDILELVKIMLETTKFIHSKDILIVDANYLNFLVDKTFSTCLFIDCDSYQTKSYPATAIMPSVMDPLVTGNSFTINSDYYSLSITLFELLIGCSPFKGRHPDFKRNDFLGRMKAGVSLYDKRATPPPNTQPLSVIPMALRKYFEAIFSNKHRGIPPEIDASIPIPQPQIQIIASTETFGLRLVRVYKGDIETIKFINGVCYCFTSQHIYAENKILWTHSVLKQKRIRHDFCYVQNDQPLLLIFNGLTNNLECKSFDGSFKFIIPTTGYFISNQKLYAVVSNNLIEYSFLNLGKKIIVAQQIASSIFHSHIVFKGMVAQDILGTARLTIPFNLGTSTTHIPEIDKFRLISGKCDSRFAAILGEQNGKLSRFTICFDEKFQSYDIRIEKDVNLHDIQLVTLEKGLAVATNENAIELFYDNKKVKRVDHSPITSGQQLIASGNTILLSNHDKLYEVHLK